MTLYYLQKPAFDLQCVNSDFPSRLSIMMRIFGDDISFINSLPKMRQRSNAIP